MSDAQLPSSPAGGSNAASSDARNPNFFLPIDNISRIMKKALPQGAKIDQDAKVAVQKCVSEFIGFITSEAAEKCERDRRKVLTVDDLLWAMGNLGFEDYLDPLNLYRKKYHEAQTKDILMSNDEQLDGYENSYARITKYKRPQK